MNANSGNPAMGRNIWVLRGKLRPPLGHHSAIRRIELIRLLDEILDYQASIVVAPAGFGKTTLLTQWRDRLIGKGVRVGWLTIDNQDSDPYRLVCYCIFALAEAGVELGQLEVFAQQGLTELPLDSVLVRLLAAIEDSEHKVALVLDDYHQVESKLVDELIDTLISNAPGNFHLVVSSRHRPSFNMAHHCMTGKGIQVDSESLRFSDAEMDQALHDIDDAALVDAIKRSTEGWPVAVQLARLAYADGFAPDRATMTGREGHIAHYFSEQVVRGLEENSQAFLTRTAILDQFNLELAKTVYGGKGAARILNRLDEDLGALIVRLDEDGEWYRYHHLFAEFLLKLLRECEPDRIGGLHASASAWYEQDGDTQQAVGHSVAAGNLERAAALIESAGGWELILFGGIGYLRNLLNLMPKSSLAGFPRLEIAQAYLFLKMGRVAEGRAYFDRACRNPELASHQGEWAQWFERDVLNIGALLHSYEDNEEALCAASVPDQLHLPDGVPDSVTRGVLCCYKTVGELAQGRLGPAGDTIRRAMRFMRQSNSVLGLNYCYIHAAVRNFQQCHVGQALADARESSAMAVDNFGSDSGLKSISDVILSVMLFWRNQLNEEGWHRFQMAYEHVSRFDGWFDIYSLALEADVERALLRADFEEAIRAVERGRRLARDRALDRLNRHTDALALTVATERGDRAEQRLLANVIEERHGLGAWKERGFIWRNHVLEAMALAIHHAALDPGKSEAHLRDAIACCRRIGARFWLLRLLCLRAVLFDRMDQRRRSIEALSEALTLAQPEGLIVAVSRPRSILGAFRHAQSHWRREPGNTATRRFAGEAINLLQQLSAGDPGSEGSHISLSPREMEVLWELSLGRSNKQIARSLYMTEHTVKFHLKNVFRKLSVNRRTEAIRIANETGLI